MKIEVVECPKKTCRYRWRPRVKKPKECPDCKTRFEVFRLGKPKAMVVEIKSRDELRKLKQDIDRWNEKGRWESD